LLGAAFGAATTRRESAATFALDIRDNVIVNSRYAIQSMKTSRIAEKEMRAATRTTSHS
jgi:hypothetical protein